MVEGFPCGFDAFAEGCCEYFLVERKGLSDRYDVIV